MLQQDAASFQLTRLKRTIVNQKEPLRLVLDLRARTWPGAVDTPKRTATTAAAATTMKTSQVQAKKADCVPARGLPKLKAVGRGGEGEGMRKGKEETDTTRGIWNKGIKGLVSFSQIVSVAQEKVKLLVSPEMEREGKKKAVTATKKRRKWEMCCFL